MTCLRLPHLPGSFMHWSVGWSSRSCFPEWSRLRGEILRHLSHEADLEVPCRFHHCPCKASAIIEWVQITGPPSSLWWLTPPPPLLSNCWQLSSWPEFLLLPSLYVLHISEQCCASALLSIYSSSASSLSGSQLFFKNQSLVLSSLTILTKPRFLSLDKAQLPWTYSQMLDHGLLQRPRARVTQEGLRPPGRAQITSPLPWVWTFAWTKAGGHLALERRPCLVAKSLLTAQPSTPVPDQI